MRAPLRGGSYRWKSRILPGGQHCTRLSSSGGVRRRNPVGALAFVLSIGMRSSLRVLHRRGGGGRSATGTAVNRKILVRCTGLGTPIWPAKPPMGRGRTHHPSAGHSQAMSECVDLPPIVWKSNFHATPEALCLLHGVVDVYVADFKFGNNTCAQRIAGVAGYWETLTRNLPIAAGQGDLIVRHLLLPGHFDCCYRPIIRWMKCYLPAAKFNIRDGYLPCWKAERYTELTAPLDAVTSRRARALALETGLNVIA